MNTEAVARRIERFLTYVFDANEACDHACKVPLDEITKGTGLPAGLVVKVSRHLEHHGLLEYEKGAVELTVAGMLEAERLKAGVAVVPTAAKPAPKKKAKPV